MTFGPALKRRAILQWRNSAHRMDDGVRRMVPTPKEISMPFKFSVGQAVEYTPIGEKKAGLYKITRQMPKEEQAADLRYRIKSDEEVYERNVLECHLNSLDERQAVEYEIESARAIAPAPKRELSKLEIK
jgi:hypothetical protein